MDNPILIHAQQVGRIAFGDPRLVKRGHQLYDSICQHQTVVIRQISRNRAEQVGYYRFLENEQVSVSELGRSLSDHCQQQVEGRHVLSISDTSEINLQAHKGRLKPEGLGVVGNNTDVGFFIHPTLAVDAESGFPLGISNIQVWTRSPQIDQEMVPRENQC